MVLHQEGYSDQAISEKLKTGVHNAVMEFANSGTYSDPKYERPHGGTTKIRRKTVQSPMSSSQNSELTFDHRIWLEIVQTSGKKTGSHWL